MPTELTTSRPHADLTDEALLQQASDGDQAAFEALVKRYSASLFRLISSMVWDEHLTQDVMQHVFLQLYRSLPTLRTGRTLKSWLCQVARHRSIDELRRKRLIFFSEISSGEGEDDFPPLAAFPDSTPLPEELAELHELQHCLRGAIQALPPGFRSVVLLRYEKQLSFREIGQALHMPEATAKTYFYRARPLLRASLDPECAREIS